MQLAGAHARGFQRNRHAERFVRTRGVRADPVFHGLELERSKRNRRGGRGADIFILALATWKAKLVSLCC